MANFYHSQTQKSLISSILLFSITFFLLLSEVNSAETVSFEFIKFQPGQKDLILQGHAVITTTTPTGQLELTTKQEGDKPVYPSLGRALYSAPIHIWDKKTDIIANFETNFSFVINATNPNKTADGLAFFLAPIDTQPIPAQHGNGGLLGIFKDVESSEPIVAVEFDTFINPWDPESDHIGIDVQSIKSEITTPWILSNEEVASVSITFDSTTTFLSVSLSYPSGNSFTVKKRVFLSEVLDQWVRVGFSATTGDNTDHVEAHRVLSWSFLSELPDSSSIPKGFKNTILLPGDVQQA